MSFDPDLTRKLPVTACAGPYRVHFAVISEKNDVFRELNFTDKNK